MGDDGCLRDIAQATLMLVKRGIQECGVGKGKHGERLIIQQNLLVVSSMHG